MQTANGGIAQIAPRIPRAFGSSRHAHEPHMRVTCIAHGFRQIDKIVRNPLSGRKPSPQVAELRKPGIGGGRACFPKKFGGTMTVLKEIAAAMAGVWALIAACDVVFGVGNTRFDDDYYRASFYAPQVKQTNEFRFAADIAPAARVADAFAQFKPGEARHGRRYSSLATIVR